MVSLIDDFQKMKTCTKSGVIQEIATQLFAYLFQLNLRKCKQKKIETRRRRMEAELKDYVNRSGDYQ